MRSLFRALFLLPLLVTLSPSSASAANPTVLRADLNGDINNVAAGYVRSTLDQAERTHAVAYLLVLNTPGGFSTSVDDIVTTLLNSSIPTIVYVAPRGSRAASAGLFIAQAADVLAMAPSTNIGSSHPILPSGGNLGGNLRDKVVNDAVTRVRSLAQMHNRNADWCESAVRNSVNINAEQAVSLHVANLEATSVSQLVSGIDGLVLPRPTGSLTLHTAHAAVFDSPPPFYLALLNTLIDPTIAALLLLLAAYGLITELTTPGAILPGVVGGLAAILALVSLANLPVNLAGAFLLFFSFVLFVADLKAQTHGILSFGGLVAFALGLAFLIDTGPIGLGVDPEVIIVTSVLLFVFFVFFVNRVFVARRSRIQVGAETLPGSLGVARTALTPDGLVLVQGALWQAHSLKPISAGTAIRVIGRSGLDLEVEPLPKRVTLTT